MLQREAGRSRTSRHRTLLGVTCAALGAILLLTSSPAQAGFLYKGRPLWIGMGGAVGGRLAGADAEGSGMAVLGIGLRLIPIIPEIGFRIGSAGDPASVIENIVLGGRFMLPAPPRIRPNFRLAYSFNNELDATLWKEEPGKGLLGTHDATRHRSGLETSIGLELMLDPKKILGIWIQATAIFMPDDQGPLFNGLIEFGISLEAGPK